MPFFTMNKLNPIAYRFCWLVAFSETKRALSSREKLTDPVLMCPFEVSKHSGMMMMLSARFARTANGQWKYDAACVKCGCANRKSPTSIPFICNFKRFVMLASATEPPVLDAEQIALTGWLKFNS